VRIAGIMSGTSLDGVDVAIVDYDRKLNTVAFVTVPYPPGVREALLKVSNAVTHTSDISRLNSLLPRLYRRALLSACRKGGIPRDSVKLIGCHGQTIFHEGRPVSYLNWPVASTLQIGDGSVLAELTGIPVVWNFRPRDMAAGGQGAPLVPFVDYLLLRHARRHRVALNIGGIANITYMPAGAPPERVVAFDTGPGNMVMDALASLATGGRSRYDRDGRMAAKGALRVGLLNELLDDDYYQQPAPKSTGREKYGDAFVQRLLRSGHRNEDLLTTAAWLTACTAARAIRDLPRIEDVPVEVIVSGGGVHNSFLMSLLAALMPFAQVASSARYGIDPDAKEAIAFAVLAWQTWRGRPGNLPSATGAKRAVVLGTISR
jgi:anhydro-N-acetylmuramic acid kinase